MKNKCELPNSEKAGAARRIVAELFKEADTALTDTAYNATTNAVARVPEDPSQIELVSFPIETTANDSDIPINLDGNNVIYTEEQTEAINRMKQFVSSVFKDEVEEKDIVKGFLLTGSAGTGKTTILKGLVEAVDDANITDGITVVASAVSGLATGNLFSKINKANTPNGRVTNVIAKTVYALFGSAGATEQSKYNRSNGENTKLAELESKIYTSNVIILLDEASMLDDATLDGLQNIIKEARKVDRKVCIIYSGDLAQISPIIVDEEGENKKKNKNIITKCSLFIKGKGDVKYIREGASLTKVIRQGESSPILDYATNVAKLSTLADNNTNVLTSYNRRNSIISPTGALLIMKNSGGMEYIMPAFVHARNSNSPLYVKYITYTNDKVKEVNTKIVESLFPDIQKYNLYAAENEWFLLYKIYNDIANATPFKITENLPKETPESRDRKKWKSFKLKDVLVNVANLDHILNGIQNLPSDVNFNMLDDQFHIYETKVDVYTAEGEIVSKVFYYLPEDQMERFLKTAYLLRTAIISILNNKNNYGLRGSLWRAYYNTFSKAFNTPEAPSGQYLEAYVKKGLKSAGALPFYAITTHKAQGCTFEICAFDKDSYNSNNLNIVETAEMMYVALTRAANVSIMLTDASINNSHKEELIGLNQTISGNRNSISAALFPQVEDAEIIEESDINSSSSSSTLNNDAGQALEGFNLALQKESLDNIKKQIKELKEGKSIQEFITGKNPFFSTNEIKAIEGAIGKKGSKNGNGLHVVSLDRQTDAVLFAKEVIEKLKENAKLRFGDPNRFYAVELWSKHDGQAMFDILEACKKYRVAPMVQFTVTGLGNTAIEPGVKKWEDLMEDIKSLIESGILDPNTTCIRIDPIIPGVTNWDTVADIISKSKELGISKFISSLLNSYENLKERGVKENVTSALKAMGINYNWDTYYNPNAALPKEEVKQAYYESLEALQEALGVTIKICAGGVENSKTNLIPAACLDPDLIETVTGINVKDANGNYVKDKLRPNEHCYGNRSNLLGQKYPCYSNCAFCYAAKGGMENVLRYYNKDGELDLNNSEIKYLSKMQKLEDKINNGIAMLKNAGVPLKFKNVVSNEIVNLLNNSNIPIPYDKEITSAEMVIEVQKNLDIISASIKAASNGNVDTALKYTNIAYTNINNILEGKKADYKEFSGVNFASSTHSAYTNVMNTVLRKKAQSIDNIKTNEIEKSQLAELYSTMTPEEVDNATTAISEYIQRILKKELQKAIEDVEKSIINSNSELEKAKKRKLLNLLNNDKTKWAALTKIIELSKIIDKTKESFKLSEEHRKFFGEDAKYHDNVYNNFEVLFKEAKGKIEESLEIRIIEQEVKEKEEKIEESNANEFDENMDSMTSNTVLFKIRHLDSIKTATSKSKEFLSRIRKYDRNGKPENLKGFVNIPSMHNMVELFITLEYEFNNHVISSEDFAIYNNETGSYSFPLFDKIRGKYSWIKTIEENINKSDEKHDIVASLFGDLRKDKIDYVTYKKDFKTGEMRKIEMSKSSILDSAVTTIIRSAKEGKIKYLNTDLTFKKPADIARDNASINIGNSIEDLRNICIQYLGNTEINITEDNKEKVKKALLSYISNIGKVKDGMSWEEIIDNREYRKVLNTLANTVSTINQVSTDVTFYHNGNTYQSFRDPSEVIQKIKLLNRKESRGATIEAYRKDPFYKKSHLLTHMEKYVDFNIEYQEMFEFNGKEYAELNDLDIDCILLYQFYSNIKNTYYRMPLHSDSEFISFLKLPVYRTFDNAEMNTLKDGIKSVIKQELQRMSNIQNRRQNESITPIDYYDEQANTSKFHYFPILNNTKFLEKIKELKYNYNEEVYNKLLNGAVDYILKELQKKAIAKVENEDFVNEFYNIVKNNEAFKNIISNYRTNNTLEAKLKARKEALAILYYNYLVNNALAQTQILTLFYGDVAFYKNNVEVQKRGKQLIASGRRPFTGRPDIDGKLSSKVDKVITLKDKIRPSRSYSKIAKVLGKEKASNFLKVNSTDAQAFRTLPSYVKIMKSWGFWNTKVDDAIVNRIIQGEANIEDFNVMYQTLKPFVYGLVEKYNINAKGEETRLLVPKQHKDSEMVLLSIYKHLDSVLNGDSALKGLNDFMVSRGIDVAIFESGVKEGNQGAIDINYSGDKLKKQVKDNGEAFEDIDDYLDYYTTKLENGKITQEEFSAAMDMIEPSAEEVKNVLEKVIADSTLTAQVIHEVPLDNYMKAQDNPEHLMDTTCIYGTQLNVLAVSDLPMNDPEFEVKVGNKKISAKEALELYNNIRTEKFILGYEKAKEWFSSKKKLKEKLESLIKTNSNYNIRLLDALSLIEVGSFDKRDDFNTPINMPNMVHSLSGMMLSIFKNNVTRHEYKGGTATLATDWGLFDSKTHKSGAPEIVFDSEGNLEAVECYLPATSENMFAAFLEEKTDANGKTYYILNAENMDEGLRMCLGYRIPTENKYSMLPLRIKGFLPQQCGGSIILPADITTIAGSDFDIDKAFILLPEFKIENKINWKELHKGFRKAFPELIREENREINNYLLKELKKAFNEKAGGKYVKNYKQIFKDFLEDAKKNNTKQALRGVLSEDLKLRIKDALDAFIYENKNKYKETPTLTRVTADLTKDPSTWTEAERHNTLLELLNNIITHPKMQKNFLSPGNADALGIGGKVVSIVNSKETINALKEEHDSIEGVIKVLENPKKLSEIKIKEEEPSIISDENFKKYHKQNMTGASLISNYAISSVSHSKMNYLNKKLNPQYVIKVDGKELSILDPTYDTQNTLVSSNSATGISAAVDNAKDQKLAKVLQSPKTSNVFEASNRLGIPIKTYIYAVSHPLVYDSFMTTGDFSKIQSIVSGLEEELKEHYDRCVEFNSKTFIEAALNYQEGKLTKSDVEVFKFINHLAEVGEQLTDLSLNTRQDSVNGGIASTLAGAILQVIKVRLMNQNINIIENVEDLVKENLLDSNDSIESIRTKLRESELPQVQAGYTLGIEQALKEISKYTELASSEMIEMIEFICSQSGRYAVSEKIVTSFLYDFLYDTIIRSLQEKGVDYISSRSYYLEEFPKFFMSNIKTNKKFNNLKIIKLINFNKGELQCVINNKNKNLKAQLERELDSLVMSGDEDSVKLAKDLLMYSLYKDGLAWGATSYATLFTPSFINSFSDLFEDLRDLKVDDIARNNEFIRKFYYNHFHEYGILPQVDVEGELGIKHYSTVTTELPHTQFKVLFDNKTKQVSLLQLKEQYSDSKEAVYENLNIVKSRYDKSYLFYGDVEDYKNNISVVETEVELEKLEKLTKTNLDTYKSTLDKYREQGEKNNNFCKK